MIQPLLVFSGWAILFLRIVLGVVLFAHGFPKIKNLKGTGEWMGGMGFRPGIFWATVVSLVEVFGGLALIFGLFTQAVAVLVVIEFLVIILKVNFKKGLVKGYELDLFILASALVLATIGGGNLSLDSFFGIIFY